MAWYKTGTVAVTNGSTTVTGTGTNFVSGAQVGEAFQGPDGELYEITTISSATSLTLGSSYGGSTASGQSYAIIPTQSLVADLATDVSTLISDYQDIADNAGEGKFADGSAAAPGITFSQDQDTGFFRDTANEIAVSIGGTKIGEFNSSGANFTGAVDIDTSLNVDGTVTVDGLNSSGAITIEGSIATIVLNETDQTDKNHRIRQNGGNFSVQKISDDGSTITNNILLSHNGDLSLYKNDGSTVGFIFDASTGRVGVNGSSSAYGVLHISDDNTDRDMDANASGQLHIDGNGYGFGIALNSDGAQIYTNSTARDLIFGTNEQERMRIANDKIGIGTSVPNYKLVVSDGGAAGIEFGPEYAGDTNLIQHYDRTANAYMDVNHIAQNHRFGRGSSEWMRITNVGNLGLSMTDPDTRLSIASGTDGTGEGDGISFYGSGSNKQAAIKSYNASSYYGDLRFYTSSTSSASTTVTERMRLTESGDLVVGGTSNNPHTNSAQDATDNAASVDANGYFSAARYGGIVGYFNRTGSDGEVLRFIRDGATTVGSIVSRADTVSTLILDPRTPGSGSGAGIGTTVGAIVPANTSGLTDAYNDLGEAGTRWKDLYLSGHISMGGQITGGQLSYTNVATLYDDSVYVLTPENVIGIVMYAGRNDNYDYIHGIVSYRTSANTYATQMGAGNANVLVGEFSGVPGVSNVSNGYFSVVVSDNGNIYFWNRLGLAISFSITLLGS